MADSADPIVLDTRPADAQPAISFVIATYNAATTLRACLESLVRQNAKNHIEVLISDGASSDDTAGIAKEFSDRLPLWLRVAPDAGISDAWNQALPALRGRWVWFLGSDDCLADDSVVADVLAAVDPLPRDVAFAYVGVGMGPDPENTVRWVNEDPIGPLRLQDIREIPVCHTGLLQRRKLFDTVGGFDTQYRIGMDFDWLLRCLKELETPQSFCQIPRTGVFMGDAGISTQLSNRVTAVQEMTRALKAHGLPPFNAAVVRVLATGAVESAARAALGHEKGGQAYRRMRDWVRGRLP